MWGRRNIAIGVESGERLPHSSETSGGEDEEEDDGLQHPCRRRSSRGVQVSPEHIRSGGTAGDTDLQNTHYSEASPAAPLGRSVGVGNGNGNGSGRIVWRWPSRRLERHSSGSGRELSPGSGDGSPNGRLLRRRGKGAGASTAVAAAAALTAAAPTASATTGTTTTTTTTTTTPLPHLARARRRRSLPLRNDSAQPATSVSDAASVPALSPSPSASRSSPSDSERPERLVASMLLRGRGDDGWGAGCREPISPATSVASDNSPGWAERAGLADGATSCIKNAYYAAATHSSGARSARGLLGTEDGVWGRTCGDRDVPRFLRPVLMLLTLSLLAIVGSRVGRGIGMFGPAVYAAGGAQLPEAVVDDIFERADKDHDGVIADEEIHYLVEGAGGTLLDDASEIKAGVESVIKNLDRNEDHALSRSDLLSYWKRLGTLLTVDEVARWVVHAAQLPQEVADTFRNNMVTGYDFPELAANQGVLLEQDLGVTRPAFRKRLVRSMKWKLWGMGEEPDAPSKLRAVNAPCGAVSLDWDPSESNLSFPVHKFVLRRATLGKEGERAGEWVTVMDGPNRAFFDARVKPGVSYRYSLQAWNALGHSASVEVTVLVATADCGVRNSRWWWWWWWWSGGGGEGGFAGAEPDGFSTGGMIIAVVVASAAAAVLFRTLGTSEGPRPGRRSRDKNDHRAAGGHPEPPGRVPVTTGTAAKGAVSYYREGDSERHQTGGSRMSPSSSGAAWSDRDNQRRRVSSSSTSSLLRPATSNGSKKAPLKPGNSDGVAPASMAVVEGRPSSVGRGGSVAKDISSRAEVTSAAAVESMRKEAARRLMSRGSNSREEKATCVVCRREWRWYRPGKHTCCKCHEQFCDRKECGMATHSFGACPVGGTCMCDNCIG